MNYLIKTITSDIERLNPLKVFGRVTGVQGMLVEAGGVQRQLSLGERCDVIARDGRRVPCEAVGFRDGRALLMPFQAIDGVGLGCRTEVQESESIIYPSDGWLGRVVDGFGNPVDAKGGLPMGETAYPIHNRPPPAHSRGRVQGKIDLGVRAINAFLTCCRGQRMGIFAGSGVGKSSLMSMMARNTSADVAVIGLIGERGREAREFIEDDLGPEGMKRACTRLAELAGEPARQVGQGAASLCVRLRPLPRWHSCRRISANISMRHSTFGS